MYRDAVTNDNFQQILVSNDSDLELPLKLIRADAPTVELGLVIPRPKPDGEKRRPGNKSLSQHVHWTRGYILDEECAGSQLDESIPTRKKPILKPAYW